MNKQPIFRLLVSINAHVTWVLWCFNAVYVMYTFVQHSHNYEQSCTINAGGFMHNSSQPNIGRPVQIRIKFGGGLIVVSLWYGKP